jgi:transcriptional regulator with XRE-family HTH domain
VLTLLGERLKKLRNERKITQEELGKKVNVTKVSISGYENGNRNPDTETLQKLADFFEVSTDYLLGRTDNPQGSINIHYDGGNGLELEDEDEEEYMRKQLAEYRKLKKRMQARLKNEE